MSPFIAGFLTALGLIASLAVVIGMVGAYIHDHLRN
jgi:hypothetical protein